MAYREAGYTVACWSLGFRIKRATITLHDKPIRIAHLAQSSPVFVQQRPIKKEHFALP